jgi:hypothetical protein
MVLQWRCFLRLTYVGGVYSDHEQTDQTANHKFSDCWYQIVSISTIPNPEETKRIATYCRGHGKQLISLS